MLIRKVATVSLVHCPNNKRDAPTILLLINSWVLPGTIIYSDEWNAYNNLWLKITHVTSAVNYILFYS